MNDGIFAVIKRYEKINENEQVIVDFEDYKLNNYNGIYEKIMELTNGNRELSSDAASWCELATVGNIYETDNWEIEIQEID